MATIDYRHAREAPFPAQLHDAKAAVRWLRAHADELGVDATRVGVWGESAGGHLAALVGLTAHRPDLEGDLGVVGPSSAVDVVVDWYGVSDLGSMVHTEPPRGDPRRSCPRGPRPAAGHPARRRGRRHARRRGPHLARPAGAPPFLLVHGDADPVVPHQQSEVLAAALADAGVEARLETGPGRGHGLDDCEDVDAVVRLSVDFLARCAAATHPVTRNPEPRSSVQ